ncbi:hypothetical protein G9A89_008196 [Geosiphon pyriformis]|nr:hypothetical protein G9A89_008196 [Geosiphon pyriformis]
MAYVLIAKLKKFTGEKNDAQVWLNDVEKAIATNRWNNARAILVNKLQDFNAFKIEFLKYFSNNNSINRLANTFTTIKQGENKAVTTYLGCFHRNLHQIQAINTNYFTVAQILNQFICRLCSSILQHVCSLYPIDLQAAVTNAQDFEAAELEANHAQTINLKHVFATIVVNKDTYKLIVKINIETPITTILSELHTYNTAATLSSTSISSANLLTDNTDNLSAAVTTHLSAANPKAKIDSTKLKIINGSSPTDLQFFHTTSRISTIEFGHWVYPKPKFSELFKDQPTLTSNIPPATITKNKLLDWSRFGKKPITAIYTDVKVDGHFIKLILDSELADSIITKQLIDQLDYQVDRAANAKIITTNGATKTLIGEIDDFSIKVNSIIILIKVLIIEATQYQALIRNDWLFKTNVLLNWNMQELQISQNGQHTCIPATCSHFKTTNLTTPLIKFKKEEKKPIWEAYQVFWTDTEHNKLPSIPLEKKREKKKNQQPTATSLIIPILHPTDPLIAAQNWYALIVARNCHQWVLVVATMRNNELCLACGETFLNEEMWNNIFGDWMRKGMPIDVVWRQAIKCLDRCPHDDDKIWQMALTKIKGMISEEIKTIKNNPPEPIELD